MTEGAQLQDDIRFVRDAIARREQQYHIPVPIIVFWAVYVLVGYAMLDFNPQLGGMFLMMAGILGGIGSGFVGRAYARRAGEIDNVEGMKHWLHWGSILVAIVAVIALSMVARLNAQVMGQFIALVVGVVYFLAGVHFDRNFLWVGLLLMAGAVAVSFIPRYPWTALGLVIAIGLLLPLVFRQRRSVAAAHG